VFSSFERGPRVDNHNQSRQHELAMEEAWLTQDFWFRLATTLACICVTDCWKLAKLHVSASHPSSALTIKDLADIISKTLVYHGIHDHALHRPNVGEGQYPYLWPNRNGSPKKSASTIRGSRVTLAAPKRAEASKLAATATRVSCTGGLFSPFSVGFPYVCPDPAIATTTSSTTCE
jgi:hypothetical protein